MLQDLMQFKLHFKNKQRRARFIQFTNVASKGKLDEQGSSGHNEKSKHAVNKLTHHQVSRGRTVFTKPSSVKTNLM